MRQHQLFLGLGALGMIGCALNADTSHTRSETDDLGSLGLAIAIAPGLDITSLRYSVQVPGLAPIQGNLPVAADGSFRGKIEDVPAAESVTVVLDASGASGATCTGQGTVAVRAGEVSTLTIGMQCRLPVTAPPVPTTGSISIQGSFDVCPRVLAAAATPGTTSSTSALTANAEDADGDAMTFAWSASGGSFADAAVANTTYSCGAPGEAMLTVTVTDGRGCSDSKVVLVTCETPSPPPVVCGDGKKEGDEACDDGNTGAGDGCSATCTVEPPPTPATDIPCDVQAILQTKCQGCHGDPPSSGPMPLVTLAQLHADSAGTYAGTPVYARVKERINNATNPMPPAWGTTGTLSEAEKATLNDWLLAGAPGASCPTPQ
jgi:cysteine-rich repeat protein